MKIGIGFVHELGVNSQLVQHFYAKNWKRKIAISEKFFYDWQFINNPNSNKKDHCVIAFDYDKNEVLGVMGLSKRNFLINGESLNGAELTTWVVNDHALGLGLGGKILKFIQSKFEVLIGMGISENALPIYMKSGFRYMKHIPRFVKVLNFERIKDYAIFTNLAISLVAKSKKNKYTPYCVNNVTSDIYSKFYSNQKNKLNLFSRDNQYRLWRYDDHPTFNYKQFIVKNSAEEDSPAVFVAFREELSIKNLKILHVTDLFGDSNSLPSAISFLENYSAINNFDAIDFYCTSSNIYRFLLVNGWFSIVDDTCFQFPHLFHPIEMRNPPTTSLIYWSKNKLTELADISRLYITKQDVDLDRPIIHKESLYNEGSV